MNMLITGANGFLGKNLIEQLVKMDDVNIMHFDAGTSIQLLEKNLSECDFLFHFAAVHRPKDNEDFYRINDDFFEWILTTLEKYDNRCPVLFTSSIQATDNNDYGRSKLIAENLLKEHCQRTGSKALIYRLTNIFGKWAAPNHHSVVATFCYNINRDLPIHISNRRVMMHFNYIDDVIDSFVGQLGVEAHPESDGLYRIEDSKTIYITLGELADTFYAFRACQKRGEAPQLKNQTEERLWVTYQSYEVQS